MANDYYVLVTPLISGSVARAGDVNTQLSAIEAGFDKLPSVSSFLQGTSGYAVGGGTANFITAAPSLAWASYLDGSGLAVKIAVTNTGPATISVSGLSPKPVLRHNGAALASGDLLAGSIAEVRYDIARDSFLVTSFNSAETAVVAAYVAAASASAALAQQWAAKPTGTVDGTDISALAAALLAKDWASKASGTVDGVNQSAKQQATLAKDWASKLVTTVDGVDFSAKYHAQAAGTSASGAAASAASVSSGLGPLTTRVTSLETMTSGSGRPALVPLNTITVSSAVAVIDVGLPGAWDWYELHLTDLRPTATASPSVRFSRDSGATFAAGASDYRSSVTNFGTNGSSLGNSQSAGGAAIPLLWSSNTNLLSNAPGLVGVLRITGPGAGGSGFTSNPQVRGTVSRGQTADYFWDFVYGELLTGSGPINAVRLLLSASTWARGTIFVLGGRGS